MKYDKHYRTDKARSASPEVAQLLQLMQVTQADDLISLQQTQVLLEKGYVVRILEGLYLITEAGLRYLLDEGYIAP
jgi:predicted transcriptional regulator of viral defense system